MELVFQIDRGDKPILYVRGGHADRTSCLIDTGANLPVWLIGQEYLQYRYPQAFALNKKSVLNGLGDRPLVDVPVWQIPEFVLTDDGERTLTYHGLPVAVLESAKFSFDMILPLTMFNRMDFLFSYTESALYGTFHLWSDRENCYIRQVYAKGGADYLNRIQAMFEEEVK